MTYLGDFADNATVSFEFNAYDNNGVPAALGGTLANCITVYKSGSTTAYGNAFTPTVLDSKTGLYRVTIDMSLNDYFAVATDYAAVITGAGVTNADGASVVNTKLATWSCENRTATPPDGSLDADKFAADTLLTGDELAAAITTYDLDEPMGVPTATASLAAKIGFLYAALRNKVTVTNSQKTFYDDADAALYSKAVSDNGTTYTEAEATTPS